MKIQLTGSWVHPFCYNTGCFLVNRQYNYICIGSPPHNLLTGVLYIPRVSKIHIHQVSHINTSEIKWKREQISGYWQIITVNLSIKYLGQRLQPDTDIAYRRLRNRIIYKRMYIIWNLSLFYRPVYDCPRISHYYPQCRPAPILFFKIRCILLYKFRGNIDKSYIPTQELQEMSLTFPHHISIVGFTVFKQFLNICITHRLKWFPLCIHRFP